MAFWRDRMKFLLIGLSGLQYESTIHSSLPSPRTESTVLRFLQSRKCVLDVRSASGSIRFTRGNRWLGRLSWLLLLPEKWAFQTITLSVTEENELTTVHIAYDVWLFLTLIVPPNQLEREVSALRAALATQTLASEKD